MKGKKSFSAAHAHGIRSQLEELRRADRATQKKIRKSLRKDYGFYITDFDNTYKGFCPVDFDAFVACGEITVES